MAGREGHAACFYILLWRHRLIGQIFNVPCMKGVNYTIKDGIVFDAKELLGDVERMVRLAKDQ